MPRLFTAIEIPPEVARALQAYRGGVPGARWVEPADYHVTLRFLGDLDGATARDLYDALGEGRPREPFPVTLDALASFGGDRPRTVYAGVAPNRDLLDLQAEQERIVRRLGIPPETRKFTPHVTLARLRGASALDVGAYIAAHGRFEPLTFLAERFVLFSSRASLGGGPYLAEAAYPFG